MKEPREAAEVLAISDRTLWGLMNSGEIPAVRIGKRLIQSNPFADLKSTVQPNPSRFYFVTRYRDTNANLRTQLLRIIRRAGLKSWPKLFQNLRSTRQTELGETFPSHVVCAWMGNSRSVAAKHYVGRNAQATAAML